MRGVSPGMSDEALCDLLLSKAHLTDMQMTIIVAVSTEVVAGAQLSRGHRSQFMSIAAAQGLLKKPDQVKVKQRPNLNTGDPYTERRTPGTEFAERVLAKGRTPSGRMIAPPKRRVG